MTPGPVAELAVLAWRDHTRQVQDEQARDAAASVERLRSRLRAILPAGTAVEVRTEPSLVMPGWSAAVADLDPHGLAVELPHLPRSAFPGDYPHPGEPRALVLCAACDQQVPSAFGGPVATLADLGRAVEAGPGPHKPGPRRRSGPKLDPDAPCPGGTGDEPPTDELTPAAALAALLDAMVSDAVDRKVEGMLG